VKYDCSVRPSRLDSVKYHRVRCSRRFLSRANESGHEASARTGSNSNPLQVDRSGSSARGHDSTVTQSAATTLKHTGTTNDGSDAICGAGHVARPNRRDRAKPNGNARRPRAATSAPSFDAMHKDASRRKFDIVMAWSVDRLGRSLQDDI
jgi:hypothetical protein